MSENHFAGQSGKSGDLAGYLAAVRGRVRLDRRGTSIPLLVLGGATAIAFLPALIWPTSAWTAFPGREFGGLIVTLAFASIWLAERRRAARLGVGTPRGFGAAVILCLAILILAAILAQLLGPFGVFAIGLLVAGRYQRNAILMSWAVVMGILGIANNFHWISNRLPASLLSPRIDPAISMALAAATVAAGIVCWLRESRVA
jgi:hypothetical protein